MGSNLRYPSSAATGVAHCVERKPHGKVLGVSFGTKNGNNDCICKEALMGAVEEGCEVEFIRAQDLDIRHCTGCIACVKSLMSGAATAASTRTTSTGCSSRWPRPTAS